jgi:hypothetical protein
MNVPLGPTVPLCLLFAGLCFTSAVTTAAQAQAAQTTPPPKVLEITTEVVKAYQGGTPHEKTEALFAQASRDSKWPEHYLGLNSLTGRERAIFLQGYDSFADWQKDMNASHKDAAYSAKIDTALAADSALLESVTTSAYAYRGDLSLRAPVDIGHMRYFEISIFHVRIGHEKDWEALSKMYMNAYDKVPDAHWATFEKMYGADSANTFIIVSPMKSLGEVDQEIVDDKNLPSTVGADQMQKMMDLGASTIESIESNLYAINPKMSYPTDNWIQADPDFWNQR